MTQTARSATIHRAQAAYEEAKQLSVRFWGVRGSVPTPISSHQRYGGNTICVEAIIGNQHIIFDGGTGLVGLGDSLRQKETPTQAHMFFTHTQWDRIQGFPFFQPAFTPQNQFSIYGATAPNGASIKYCLTEQMLKPHFSMPLQNMLADLSFHTVEEKSHFFIGEVMVETFRTNAVTEAIAYSLSWQNYKLVYATDTPTEHVDPEFISFIEQADLLIYDGTYRDLSYLHTNQPEPKTSPEPWEIAVDLAYKAAIKKLVLAHHSPLQDDDTLDRIQRDLRDGVREASHREAFQENCHPNITIAYEGLVINE
jgi:phosphoribosyl 1,2-cyclic phosphodiesterase